MSENKKIDLSSFDTSKIRNFSIIAHIDHGKSTLADRILELTHTISTRNKNEQFLDKLQVERERGITVKAQTVSIFHKKAGITYLLNLIDTPGHVDFSYEVSRSLAACQGALLIVDAAQGVQAQTMANFYLAFEQDLKMIPILNKIDLPNADPERISEQLVQCFEIDKAEILPISAKTGQGVLAVLDAIVDRIPAPTGSREQQTRAFLFDSWFDEYRGIICMIEIVDGELRKGDKVMSFYSGEEHEILDIGIMHPDPEPTDRLFAGQVGFMITGMRNVREAKIGDTLYLRGKKVAILPGFREAKPMVFAGLFPVDNEEYESLRDAIEKLSLNDASISVEKESSAALGFGFRCGFLGLLHMDVFIQRLSNEYDVSIISTAPSVLFRVELTADKTLEIGNPAEWPDPSAIARVLEPTVKATIITPTQYMGLIMNLCHERRGIQLDMTHIDPTRIILTFQLPLCEIVIDFYDKLKSISAGYASFDYEEAPYQEAEMVRVNILLNGSKVDALSMILHKDTAQNEGRRVVEKLKDVITRQNFVIAIQAAIGAKVIARETISPFRKDVIAKCYGGDITRKNKLLDKQKAGKKKRAKMVGSVELPQEAFLTILKR
jgi:elongation factor 4